LFLLSNQAVLSGARTDRACKLHMPTSELYKLYTTEYPDRIQNLIKQHPHLRASADKKWEQMTKIEKNIEKILQAPRADMSWVVQPRKVDTFWKVLNELNIKFVVDLHPESCKYHNFGPTWKKQLDELVQTLASNPPNRTEVEKKIKDKKSQVQNYERHLKQVVFC
jgi:hypothetical protein